MVFVLGILNLLLVSALKPNPNCFFIILVLFANGISCSLGTYMVMNSNRFFQSRVCVDNTINIYCHSSDFVERWLSKYGNNSPLPFRSMAIFDFFRMAPIFALIFLTGCNTLALFHSLIKVTMTQEIKASKPFSRNVKLPIRRNWITFTLGLAVTLTSFLATKCFCDACSLLNIGRPVEYLFLSVVLTPLGLCGMAMLNGQAPAWSRVLLMAVATLIFIGTGSNLDWASLYERKVERSLYTVMNTNCTYGKINYEEESEDYDMQYIFPEGEHDPKKSCFYKKTDLYFEQGDLFCLSKDKICDGILDIIDSVDLCKGRVCKGFYGIRFIDEIFCPAYGGRGIAQTIKAVHWLSMLLSLAMVVALGLTFRQDKAEEAMTKEEEEEEEFERLSLLGTQHKTQEDGIISSQRFDYNEVVQSGRKEEV